MRGSCPHPEESEGAYIPAKNAGMYAPPTRRDCGGRERHARVLSYMRRKRERKSAWTGTTPLTRPAPADESAAAVPPLPQGGKGAGSEAGHCQESGLYDRASGLRELRMNAALCPDTCRRLSAMVTCPLFSSTFPVRSSALLNSWGARPGFSGAHAAFGTPLLPDGYGDRGGGLWRPSPDGLQAASNQLTG